MKKIEIKNEKEVLNSLKSGRIVEGRLALVKTDDGSQQLEFVAYNRKNKRKKDKLIKELYNPQNEMLHEIKTKC